MNTYATVNEYSFRVIYVKSVFLEIIKWYLVRPSPVFNNKTITSAMKTNYLNF